MSVGTKLLTVDDLAERWSCHPKTAWERVKERGVAFLWLGPGAFDASKHGPKFVRFRIASIEAFEAQEIRHRGEAEEKPSAEIPKVTLSGMPATWDGVIRGRRKAKA